MTGLAAQAVLRASADREAWVGRVLLAVAAVAALLIGSNLFQVSGWMQGDLAYHRGVAYTMQGEAWQGEGPYPGLLSYYGGLYPLLLGRAAAAFDVSFDTVLSVASWVFALLWPAALWWLGRRIWAADPLAVGLFVVLGTTAAPFTHRALVWVDSVLASAQNAFPVYPRDVAIVLVVVLAAALLSPNRRERVLVSGLVLGGIVLVHLQIAILASWLAVVWTGLRARREAGGAAGPVRELAGIWVLAAGVSAWWWLPRLLAAIESRGVLLGGYPGTPELRLGPDNAIMAFGVVALLAALGFGVLAARRPLPGALLPFLLWIAAFVPLVALDRLAGGFDLLSERRVWLLVSIPLTVVAAATAALALRRLPPVTATAFVLLAVLAPSLPGIVGTQRLVEGAWQPGRAGGRTFDVATWEPIFRELNARVRAEGRYVVATYDAYETWVWSFSGAQVPSLWLPGPFKLGFDPARLTGTGHDERVAAQTAGFQNGLAGICDIARRFSADAILLDGEAGMVGIHDVSPAAAHRLPVRARSESTISRVVAPGTTYRDLGSIDVLTLAPGARWGPGWTAPAAGLVALEIAIPAPPPGAPAPPPTDEPAVRVIGLGGSVDLGRGLGPGVHRLTLALDIGVPPDLEIEAVRPLDLIRVTAFSPLPGPEPADRPTVRPTADWCAA